MLLCASTGQGTNWVIECQDQNRNDLIMIVFFYSIFFFFFFTLQLRLGGSVNPRWIKFDWLTLLRFVLPIVLYNPVHFICEKCFKIDHSMTACFKIQSTLQSGKCGNCCICICYLQPENSKQGVNTSLVTSGQCSPSRVLFDLAHTPTCWLVFGADEVHLSGFEDEEPQMKRLAACPSPHRLTRLAVR